MTIKKGLATALLVSCSAFYSHYSFSQIEAEDDTLLLSIPAMIAGTRTPTDPLVEVRKLAGSWVFQYGTSFVFNEEFRFLNSTARLSATDSNIATITGRKFLSNFSFQLDTPVSTAYTSRQKVYLTAELWGPPDTDSASYYAYSSISTNDPGDCHYFGDTQGNIRDYYIGFGGTIPCDTLRKRKVSNVSGKVISEPSTKISNNPSAAAKLADNVKLAQAQDNANRVKHQQNLAVLPKTSIDILTVQTKKAKAIAQLAKTLAN